MTEADAAARAERLAAAYDAFLAELGTLAAERRALVHRIVRRMEEGHIEEIRKRTQEL